MTITSKISSLLKTIRSVNRPDKALLIEAHGKLVELLDPGLIPSSFPEAIKALKSNQVYKAFDLYTDPEIIKTIINKIPDFKIIESLLNTPREIRYSFQEEIVLNERLNLLKLLFSLEQDLKEIAEFGEKYENMKSSFFAKYFKELDYLKFIFTRSFTIDNIVWFFYTDIFDLMISEPELFTAKATDFYQKIIQNTNQLTNKNDFDQHCQILLNKKTHTGKLFNYRAFYSILNNTKKSIRINLNRTIIKSSNSIFHKVGKFPKASNKLPRQALKNHLRCIVSK